MMVTATSRPPKAWVGWGGGVGVAPKAWNRDRVWVRDRVRVRIGRELAWGAGEGSGSGSR